MSSFLSPLWTPPGRSQDAPQPRPRRLPRQLPGRAPPALPSPGASPKHFHTPKHTGSHTGSSQGGSPGSSPGNLPARAPPERRQSFPLTPPAPLMSSDNLPECRHGGGGCRRQMDIYIYRNVFAGALGARATSMTGKSLRSSKLSAKIAFEPACGTTNIATILETVGKTLSGPPRSRRDLPRTPPRRPRDAPRRFGTRPGRLQDAFRPPQARAKTPRDALRPPKIAPRPPQDAPKTP